MKQLLFGVFAHPDDEAFGPGAYLYRQAQQGTGVYLVVATDGEAGINNGYDDLAVQRRREWRESGRRIGVSGNLALHYPDGGLCNNLYLKMARRIETYIRHVVAAAGEPVQIELVTFENRGITGHLDHIAMSFVTTLVYERLRQKPGGNCTVARLLYYCLPKQMVPDCDTSWIFMPCGCSDEQIDFRHPFQDIADQKVYVMQAHESQKHDMETILSHSEGGSPEMLAACLTDHFRVYGA